MSWIALQGPGVAWTCPKRLPEDARAPGALLPRGSVMIEVELPEGDAPWMLFGYEAAEPWPRCLALRVRSDGGAELVVGQGGTALRTELTPGRAASGGAMRITYSWDAPARQGRLAIEWPGREGFDWVETPPPPPLLRDDIRAMIHAPERIAREVAPVFLAVSDAVEPLGPMPSLTGTLPVETPEGPRPLATLRPGDVVLTRGAGPQAVLALPERIVPALGSYRPVAVHAPHYGLTEDVVIAPEQRMVLGGSEVEYTFGREAVRVPAGPLANGRTGTAEEGLLFVKYRQVLLARHEAVLAAGTAFESLFVGRLRRDRPRLATTLLAGLDPALVPEHRQAGFPVLDPFQTVALSEARAA